MNQKINIREFKYNYKIQTVSGLRPIDSLAFLADVDDMVILISNTTEAYNEAYFYIDEKGKNVIDNSSIIIDKHNNQNIKSSYVSTKVNGEKLEELGRITNAKIYKRQFDDVYELLYDCGSLGVAVHQTTDNYLSIHKPFVFIIKKLIFRLKKYIKGGKNNDSIKN